MKTLTMGARFRLCFAAIFVLMLILGGTSIYAIRSMNQQFETAVSKTVRKLQLGGQIDTIKSDMYVAQRGMVLATFMRDQDRAAAQKREFEAHAAKLKATLDETAPLVSVPEGKRLFPILEADLAAWLEQYQEVVRLCESGNPTKAQQLSFDKIAPVYRDLGDTSAKFITVYQGVLASDVAAAAELYAWNLWIAGAILCLGALAGAGIILMIGRLSSHLR